VGAARVRRCIVTAESRSATFFPVATEFVITPVWLSRRAAIAHREWTFTNIPAWRDTLANAGTLSGE
jgi:hypothetical protein